MKTLLPTISKLIFAQIFICIVILISPKVLNAVNVISKDEITVVHNYLGIDPVITTQPIGAIICKGGSFSPNITANTSTGSLTYQWQYSSNGLSNWTNVGNGIPANANYINPTSSNKFNISGNISPGSYYFRCVVSSSEIGSKSVNSNAVQLKITADPTVIMQPANATICLGGSYSPKIIATGGTPSLSYQWQYSANGSTGWANVTNGTPVNSNYSGATTASGFKVSGNLAAGTYYYRCNITSIGNGCNYVNTSTAILTILASPTISLQPISSTICNSGSFSPVIKALGGTPSYQWQYSSDGNTGWVNVSNGFPTNAKYINPNSSNTFTVTGNLANGNYYYRCIVSSNGCSESISNVATLSIVSPASITTQPINATICKGGTYSPTIVAGNGSANFSYQWQYSANGSTAWANVTNGTPANSTYSNSTSAKLFTVSGNISSGNFFYRCMATPLDGGCAGISNVGILTIVDDPIITTQPQTAMICVGGTYSPKVIASGGTPSLTYQWQYSANGSAGWANVVNGTPANSVYTNSTSANAFSVTGTIAAGVYFFRCIISATGSGCGSVTSSNAVLTIVSDPSISIQPLSDTICSGGVFNPKINVNNGVPIIQYQWQYSENGSTNWSNVSNGAPLNSVYNNSTNASSFSVKGDIPSGAYFYRCLVSSFGLGCDPVISKNAILTVLPLPEILAQPLDATICKGGTYNPLVSLAGNSSSYNYQWQYSGNGSTGWANVVNGTPSNGVYSNTTSGNFFSVTGNINPGKYYYRCAIYSKITGCSIYSNTCSVTVVADPTINAQPQGATINSGDSYNPNLTASGGTPSLNYQWQFSLDGSTNWKNVSNNVPVNAIYTEIASPDLFTIAGNIEPGNYYYRCLISSVGSGCDPILSNNVVLTVLKKPIIESLQDMLPYTNSFSSDYNVNSFTLHKLKTSTKKLVLYPNPSDELINIDTSELNEQEYDIFIFDCLGQLKFSVKDTNLNSFNISQLDNGVYIIQLSGAKEILTSKFIKSK